MGAPCFSTGETQACMRSSSACLGLILCAMCVVALVLLHDQPVEVNLEVKGTPSGLDGTPISLMSSKEMIAELSSTRAQNAQQHQQSGKVMNRLAQAQKENKALRRANRQLAALLQKRAAATDDKMDRLREADEEAFNHQR